MKIGQGRPTFFFTWMITDLAMNETRHIPDELIILLHEEIAVISRMIKQAEQQRDALTHFEMNSLNLACSLQGQLSEDLRILEQQRISLFSRTFSLTLKEAASFSLTNVLLIVEEQQKSEIQQLQQELRKHTSLFQQLNSVNRLLTERSKRFIRETTRILTNDGQPIYSVRV